MALKQYTDFLIQGIQYFKLLGIELGNDIDK